MPKRCAIDGCKSGWAATRKQAKLLNKKQISLFSTPTNLTQLDKWNDALSGNRKKLKSTDVVCQLHFRDEDVETHFVVVLTDGTKHTLEREKYRLKDNAVPTMLATNAECSERIEEATADSNPVVEDAEPSTMVINTIQYDHSMFRVPMSSIDEATNEDEDPFSTTEDAKIYEGNNNDFYSIECLARDLRRVEWKEGWVWSRAVDLSSIKFVHFDTVKLQPRINCCIDMCMEITIFVGEESNARELNGGTLESFADMMALFDKIEGLKVCAGTGFQEEMRATDCPGFLNIENWHRRNFASERCPPCRAARHKLQKRKPCDIDLEKLLALKKLRLLRRRHKTLQETVMRLKAKIG